ncbi:hypothetical protein GCM10010363_60920 [Streptomyces omiyaensis]|nr:hypothetical protein [Streptomyces omiyaensis]GGY71413.1 hypothetical protein GCM10010363_60920 [Streptomyces omiyaensis]
MSSAQDGGGGGDRRKRVKALVVQALKLFGPYVPLLVFFLEKTM